MGDFLNFIKDHSGYFLFAIGVLVGWIITRSRYWEHIAINATEIASLRQKLEKHLYEHDAAVEQLINRHIQALKPSEKPPNQEFREI